MIKFHLVSTDCYQAVYENGVAMGLLMKEVDGFYVFFPDSPNGGFWSEGVLKQLADKLAELNKEWKEKICSDTSI